MLTAIALLVSCGGGAADGPEPGTRVVQGREGWLLAVPSAPVAAGSDVKIWYNGSELERGPRVYIRMEVRVPDGSVGGGSEIYLGAPGWTFLPFRNTVQAGSYNVAMMDSATNEVFVEAEFRVEEE
ncbi:MAG: hypothetical protein Q7R32_08360 [Dehalococcoidia bacterium]|nr:hypothetical protein [Dehalococcoidia bacterium]